MTTRKAGPASGAGYRLEAQVGHLLRRAHQRASATFAKHIGDPQITPTQFAALVKLADEGELSPRAAHPESLTKSGLLLEPDLARGPRSDPSR